MGNTSRQQIEKILDPTTEQTLNAQIIKLENEKLEMKQNFENKLASMESHCTEITGERDVDLSELESLQEETGEQTHTIFGEEVTVLSTRIDIGHFFETLAEVSKSFTPYQLEDLLQQINR